MLILFVFNSHTLSSTGENINIIKKTCFHNIKKVLIKLHYFIQLAPLLDSRDKIIYCKLRKTYNVSLKIKFESNFII